jgi:protein-tyrosine phosphatase
MAMALMRNRLKRMDLPDHWQVASAGTWSMGDVPATPNAATVVEELGMSLDEHLSQKVTPELMEAYDLILTMESNHQEALLVEFPSFREKVFMLSEMVGERYDILDPIGGPLEEYRSTLEAIDAILERGMEEILRIARRNASEE